MRYQNGVKPTALIPGSLRVVHRNRQEDAIVDTPQGLSYTISYSENYR